jgi:hypothetical protein
MIFNLIVRHSRTLCIPIASEFGNAGSKAGLVRRGMKVLSRPALVDSWGRLVAPAHGGALRGGCSCGLCSAAAPGGGGSSGGDSSDAGSGADSSKEGGMVSKNSSDLLTSTMARNQQLEKEIAQLRVQSHISRRVDDKFDHLKVSY